MTTKNPFEIRTELLQMAKDYMDQQYHLQVEFAQRAFDAALQASEQSKEMLSPESWKKLMPQMYTMEDLTKKAQELYGFVSDSKPTRK